MSKTGRKVFTLIELLVVIAIIAILVAILLPGLRRAREMALRVVCKSNQHQMHIGWVAYTDDFDDRMAAWDNLNYSAPNDYSQGYLERTLVTSGIRYYLREYLGVKVPPVNESTNAWNNPYYIPKGTVITCPSDWDNPATSDSWHLDYTSWGVGVYPPALDPSFGTPRMSRMAQRQPKGPVVFITDTQLGVRPTHWGEGGNITFADGATDWISSTSYSMLAAYRQRQGWVIPAANLENFACDNYVDYFSGNGANAQERRTRIYGYNR